MTLLIRYCTGCGEERPFEQLHAEPTGCPDVPDGDCPEWGCSVCGDALFIGLPVFIGLQVRQHVTSGSASLPPKSLPPNKAALPDQHILTGSRLRPEPVNSHEAWCFGMNLRGIA